MSEPIQDAELAALQAALARLTPAPEGLNVARLLFRAGQASVPRRHWAWPCATAAALLLATTLGAVLVLRPEPTPREVVKVIIEPPKGASQPEVPVPLPPQETPLPPLAADVTPRQRETEYLKLREQVLAHGVESLPASTPWSNAPQPGGADTLLDLPPGAAPDPWFQHRMNSLHSGDAS